MGKEIEPLMRHWKIILILVCALLVRVWTIYTDLSIPHLHNDERAHYAYAQYIRTQHELPQFAMNIGAADLLGLEYSYENYHLPGYHILAALAAFRSTNVTEIHVAARMKILSAILGVLAILFVWLATRDMKVVLLLSFLPSIIFDTTWISNDVLFILASAMLVWAVHRKSLWPLAIAGLVAAVSKAPALLILVVLVGWYLKQREWKRFGIVLSAAVLCGFIIWERADFNAVNTTGFIVPRLVTIFEVVTQTICTAVIAPFKGEIPTYLYSIGIPVGLMILWYFHSIWWKIGTLNKLVVSLIILVWLVFSFTHIHWLGRLLFPAIPWLAVKQKE